jgi:nucleoid-associated protein YgaU
MKVIKPLPKSLTRIYRVKSGDNLAVIAKKFYGEELGNVRANIDQIYKANKKVLKSPDDIYIGQKLIIPALTEHKFEKPQDVLKGQQFTAVDDIGKRHIQTAAKNNNKVKVNYYVVREDDSLWSIASKQLGNGIRYKEIVKLNKLEDVDMLTVGMRLRLPTK